MYKQILILPLILFSIFVGAVTPTVEEFGIDARDIQAINDLANEKVPHGKFKGEPLNTSVRRPLYVIGTGSGYSDALSEKLTSDSVMIANYYHEGEFFIARIPLSAVNSVVLLEAPFSKMASHTMLRFVTDDVAPVELIAKIASSTSPENIAIQIQPLEKPILIKDMVLSIDGAEPRGKGGWNMKDAIAGSYTIAYRMVSIQERLRWFAMEGTPIHQTELNLNRKEAQRLIRTGIERSQTISWSRGYHLLCANCTNLAIRLIKDTVPYNDRVEEGARTSIKQTIQARLDTVLRPLEPLTQFTRFNLGVLGWLGKKKVDLQKDPTFQREIITVVQDLRNSIENNNHYTREQKEQLFVNLGINEELQILEDPARFKKALKAYSAAVRAQKNLVSAQASCIQIYAL